MEIDFVTRRVSFFKDQTLAHSYEFTVASLRPVLQLHYNGSKATVTEATFTDVVLRAEPSLLASYNNAVFALTQDTSKRLFELNNSLELVPHAPCPVDPQGGVLFSYHPENTPFAPNPRQPAGVLLLGEIFAPQLYSPENDSWQAFELTTLRLPLTSPEEKEASEQNSSTLVSVPGTGIVLLRGRALFRWNGETFVRESYRASWPIAGAQAMGDSLVLWSKDRAAAVAVRFDGERILQGKLNLQE